ncbi:palmitoyltransferase ZDHHC22 isoform X1 [Penaeus vannamei]|uniref:Palmitoyltransferase n=1 Tax=Penaeus vannamei TaxID=6689 RepID=A0A3R7MNX4_PENVA|nr:palmitoyltransferase ZDHHC22-like isoform X1 [Penaeus vannamei]ROT66434.1 putative palmitoyltransferase ZDHHC22-like [Penaeus vannamei]
MDRLALLTNTFPVLSTELRLRDRSAAAKQPTSTKIQDRPICWMRSPLCLCQRAWRSFVSTNKIVYVKRVVEFLTSLAPLTTLTIILFLCYYSHQLLEANNTNTVVVYFFCIELFGNWLLFFFNKSYIDKSSGNSELAPGLSHDDCKQLRYCPTCKIYKPERSHHCSLCDRCIHQRDHHCFFLGTCVGGYNLCYFIFFCFYACIGCIYAAILLHGYYSGTYLRSFWSSQFLYYFYPVTLIMWMCGKADLAEVGWVTLLYIASATVVFTGFCVIQQLIYVLRGQTAYEYNKGLLMVHRSAFHNFLHVFGRYWILHLLIPFPRRRTITDPRSFLKIV